MKMKVMSVNPGFARDAIENKNPSNRIMNTSRVSTYANAMRRGEWVLTHQGICFDEEGMVIDGQHRLAAVVEYGQPVQMLVVTGCPRVSTTSQGVTVNAMDVTDKGQARTMGQSLQLAHGVKNANNVAAIAMVLRSIVKPGSYGTALTVHQVMKIHDIYKVSLEIVLAVKWQRGDTKAGILAAFVAYHVAYPDEAVEFMRAATEMSGLSAKSPVLVWRKWVIGSVKNGLGTRYDRLAGCYVTALACEKHRKGEEATILRATPDAMQKMLAANKEKYKSLVLASQE